MTMIRKILSNGSNVKTEDESRINLVETIESATENEDDLYFATIKKSSKAKAQQSYHSSMKPPRYPTITPNNPKMQKLYSSEMSENGANRISYNSQPSQGRGTTSSFPSIAKKINQGHLVKLSEPFTKNKGSMHKRYLSHTTKLKNELGKKQPGIVNMGHRKLRSINIGFNRKISEKYKMFEDFQREMQELNIKSQANKIVSGKAKLKPLIIKNEKKKKKDKRDFWMNYIPALATDIYDLPWSRSIDLLNPKFSYNDFLLDLKTENCQEGKKFYARPQLVSRSLPSPKKTGELYELEAKNRYLEYLLVNQNNKNLPRMKVDTRDQLVRDQYVEKLQNKINKYSQELQRVSPVKEPSEKDASRHNTALKKETLQSRMSGASKKQLSKSGSKKSLSRQNSAVSRRSKNNDSRASVRRKSKLQLPFSMLKVVKKLKNISNEIKQKKKEEENEEHKYSEESFGMTVKSKGKRNKVDKKIVDKALKDYFKNKIHEFNNKKKKKTKRDINKGLLGLALSKAKNFKKKKEKKVKNSRHNPSASEDFMSAVSQLT
ncbi:unnamed protein product [Moneuplotes crassus]|uniref:Uncharacterized protein n=1 Tax=Euplotes crassus TaxID=5936 RepID=A0AAD2D6Q9_EUPCR|nr:unnamed protein product [Moneuplotes crassus]